MSSYVLIDGLGPIHYLRDDLLDNESPFDSFDVPSAILRFLEIRPEGQHGNWWRMGTSDGDWKYYTDEQRDYADGLHGEVYDFLSISLISLPYRLVSLMESARTNLMEILTQELSWKEYKELREC